MNNPIRLYDPETEVIHDQAGVIIKKSVLAPPYTPGPYEAQSNREHDLLYVPSLEYFCVKALAEVVDQVHVIGSARLRYQAPEEDGSYDLLRALIPSYGTRDFAFSQIDPRLWAVLVQLFDNIPVDLRTYHIPLSDKYVPLLQSIPSTPDFTLITLLNLSGRGATVTDNTILELKALHHLVGLDLSDTWVSSYGIRSLTGTLQCSLDEATGIRRRRGPWPLRVLRLNKCRNVSHRILDCLIKFPLLSLVDLRGTQYRLAKSVYKAGPFGPCKDLRFCTAILSENLATLAEYLEDVRTTDDEKMHSSTNIYTLNIYTVDYEGAGRQSWDPAEQLLRAEHPVRFSEQFTRQTSGASESLRIRGGADRDSDEQDEFPFYDNEDEQYNSGDSWPESGDYQDDTVIEDYEEWDRFFGGAADIERKAEASRRAVQRFYSGAMSSKSSRSPPMHSEFHRRDTDDLQCMLFRLPPPWSVLDEIEPKDADPGILVQTLTEEAVFSSRHTKKAQMAIDSYKGMINQRKMRSAYSLGEPAAPELPSTRKRSFNPFSRVPKFADGTDQEQAKPVVDASSRRSLNTATTATLQRFGDGLARRDKKPADQTPLLMTRPQAVGASASAPEFTGDIRHLKSQGQDEPSFATSRTPSSVARTPMFRADSAKPPRRLTGKAPSLVPGVWAGHASAALASSSNPRPLLKFKPVSAHQIPMLPPLPKSSPRRRERADGEKANSVRQRNSLGSEERSTKRPKPDGKKRTQFDWHAWGNSKPRKSV
ncbi:hypothetical protein NEOLEDRAFT_1177633 [Neolentinus lepideus HHB14362 ss-1]|uniref:Uncharacterized protein n=1 Tax=Neolentinus lepideus HHB14362 ss-1 TaxID=1314782 RepID=A0A165T6F8_9AGAM|nr:hypothetical protein NEOLEDRAFT_1177633 [Neolentinus lepideus HHB14362 ss-1]